MQSGVQPGVQPGAERTTPLVYDEHGGLFVDVHVNGRPVRLILDTGASRSTLSSAFAAELGLALGEGGEVEGSAGIVAARSATARLALDGHDELPIDFVVYDFRSYDPRCVGIVGAEVLERQPFQLRYRERRLVWNASPPRDTIELALDNRIPRITVHIDGEPIDLRLDTGAAFPPGADAYVNLTEDQAGFLGLEGAPVAVFTATGTGGAVLELPVHRLRSLAVAGVALPRAFAIVQPRVGYFARDDAVGFLGNAVLDKLEPFLDYRGGVFGAEAGTAASSAPVSAATSATAMRSIPGVCVENSARDARVRGRSELGPLRGREVEGGERAHDLEPRAEAADLVRAVADERGTEGAPLDGKTSDVREALLQRVEVGLEHGGAELHRVRVSEAVAEFAGSAADQGARRPSIEIRFSWGCPVKGRGARGPAEIARHPQRGSDVASTMLRLRTARMAARLR